MTVQAWPDDLAPYRVAYYLQAHRGGSESPLSRTGKFYLLSAPRWVARFTFRAGYDGGPFDDAAGFGPRLDGMIAAMRGVVRVALWDWRRPVPIYPQLVVAGASLHFTGALAGAGVAGVAGFVPNARAFSVGDYLGGDGRCHIVTAPCYADGSGVASVSFEPPLETDLAAGAPAITRRVTSPFRLAADGADDAGANETEVGQPTEYTLSFVEDLNDAS